MPCFGCTPFSWVAGQQSLVAKSSIFLCVSPERDVIPWSWRQYPLLDLLRFIVSYHDRSTLLQKIDRNKERVFSMPLDYASLNA